MGLVSLEVAEKFVLLVVVVAGGFQVATMSELNPSLELIWIELI